MDWLEIRIQYKVCSSCGLSRVAQTVLAHQEWYTGRLGDGQAMSCQLCPAYSRQGQIMQMVSSDVIVLTLLSLLYSSAADASWRSSNLSAYTKGDSSRERSAERSSGDSHRLRHLKARRTTACVPSYRPQVIFRAGQRRTKTNGIPDVTYAAQRTRTSGPALITGQQSRTNKRDHVGREDWPLFAEKGAYRSSEPLGVDLAPPWLSKSTRKPARRTLACEEALRISQELFSGVLARATFVDMSSGEVTSMCFCALVSRGVNFTTFSCCSRPDGPFLTTLLPCIVSRSRTPIVFSRLAASGRRGRYKGGEGSRSEAGRFRDCRGARDPSEMLIYPASLVPASLRRAWSDRSVFLFISSTSS